MAWLIHDGQVLASAELAYSRAERRRGLIGRDELDGVLVLRTRSVHTFGVRFPIDVAFCDDDGRVLRVVTMRRRRISPPVRRARLAIEAPRGAMAHWGVAVGDRLEIR